MSFAPVFTQLATNNPAANTAAQVTFTVLAGQRVHLLSVLASYSGAPTGGLLTITDGTTTVLIDVPAAGLVPIPPVDLRFAAGGTVTVTLAAGGAGVSGRLTVNARFEI